jgi:hypothetical protein
VQGPVVLAWHHPHPQRPLQHQEQMPRAVPQLQQQLLPQLHLHPWPQQWVGQVWLQGREQGLALLVVRVVGQYQTQPPPPSLQQHLLAAVISSPPREVRLT